MSKPLSPDQFPILFADLKERRAASFAKAIEEINKGLEAKAIANPVFKESKETVSRIVYDAYKAYVSGPFIYGGKFQDQPQDVQDLESSFLIMGLHECKSATKKVRASNATGPAVDAMKAFFDEVEPLNHAFDALKPLIVKRQILSPEEREAKERYIPPMSTPGAMESMQQVLQNVTEKKYEELVEVFCNQFEKNIARYQQADEAGRRELTRNPYARAGVYEASESTSYRSKEYTLKPDYKQILRGMAEREAKLIQDSFVFKNLKKLCSIVEKKGDFDRVEEVGSSVSLSGLEGTIRVHFKDGAHFTANNSVVWSTSVYGKEFRRFPLTFHNVILAGGERMPQPSEERMNTVFAVSAAPGEPDSGSPAQKRASGPSMG
jgi:hypothetical protein